MLDRKDSNASAGHKPRFPDARIRDLGGQDLGVGEFGVQAFLSQCPMETPALVYNEAEIAAARRHLRRHTDGAGCHPLFSLKAGGFAELMRTMFTPRAEAGTDLYGVSVSSLYEARLARDTLGEEASLHLTTPGLDQRSAPALAEVCDFISFNSLGQYSRFATSMAGSARLGLRINPEISSVGDPRYDPCRRHSKLGIPLSELKRVLDGDPDLLRNITGLHIHSNCDSTDFHVLREIVSQLVISIPDCLRQMEWINLGGGYLYEPDSDTAPLAETVDALASGSPGLEVFVEPGASLVRGAGYLVATVIDMFRNQDKMIVVLDTTVNHAPEVFEYGYKPDAWNEDEGVPKNYVLAGSTCLAGDVFGTYGFSQPLEIGSRIVFEDMGAYTMVKAQAFNGVPMPNVSLLNAEGTITSLYRPDYEGYKRQWDGRREPN